MLSLLLLLLLSLSLLLSLLNYYYYQAEAINQAACDIAKQVASEGGALFAGGVSYTCSYAEKLGKEAVQKEYKKQVDVLMRNDVDFLIAEVS